MKLINQEKKKKHFKKKFELIKQKKKQKNISNKIRKYKIK